MVGLSTAWFLQERGVEVTVLDRSGVAAGAPTGGGATQHSLLAGRRLDRCGTLSADVSESRCPWHQRRRQDLGFDLAAVQQCEHGPHAAFAHLEQG
jgi:glycine/D-amino acid oxidase-like deaminating enzyme